MVFDKFDFQEEKAVEEIKKRNAKLVLVQLPEGLKQEAVRIANLLEKEADCTVIVSGDICWGACDVSIDDARNLKVDLIVHFGHAQFIKIDYPIVYIEIQDKTDLKPLLKRSLKFLKTYTKIGLVGSVQHLQKFPEVTKFLEDNKKNIFVPEKKGFAAYDGHVVGCEYNSLKLIQDKVDCFLVIGNQVHSLGAAMSVTKPVFLIDVYNGEVVDMDKLKNKVIKQRFAAIERIKTAKNIGIIVGTKPGQRFGNFKVIIEKFRKLNNNVIVITMNEMTPDKLMNFYNIEGFIELACPRIAVEDYGKYNKPIITFRESLVVLNEMKWEDLIEKGFL